MTGKMQALFPGFDKQLVPLGRTTIHARVGGEGPPLLMLHGYPQSHATWHRIAPALAAHFTLVIPDLPGYGESGVPEPDDGHIAYSKRAMAQDMLELMAALGHRRFHLLGHDRGGRVAYRLALDHPETPLSLAIIDVVPTSEMWARLDAALALRAYHWAFLAQPHPLPERLIAADPQFYADWTLRSWTKDGSLEVFDPTALAHYRAAWTEPARIRAFCEDYRAGATIDRELDEADARAGRRLSVPMHYLATAHNFAATSTAADSGPRQIWQGWAQNVSFSQVVAGHYPQEEAPQETTDALLAFFRAQGGV